LGGLSSDGDCINSLLHSLTLFNGVAIFLLLKIGFNPALLADDWLNDYCYYDIGNSSEKLDTLLFWVSSKYWDVLKISCFVLNLFAHLSSWYILSSSDYKFYDFNSYNVNLDWSLNILFTYNYGNDFFIFRFSSLNYISLRAKVLYCSDSNSRDSFI